MVDWATISSLATAGGTLVLVIATFASTGTGSRCRAAARSSRPASPCCTPASLRRRDGGALVLARLLYTDQIGGQRTVSRFGVLAQDGDGWRAAVARHWYLDTTAPR